MMMMMMMMIMMTVKRRIFFDANDEWISVPEKRRRETKATRGRDRQETLLAVDDDGNPSFSLRVARFITSLWRVKHKQREDFSPTQNFLVVLLLVLQLILQTATFRVNSTLH